MSDPGVHDPLPTGGLAGLRVVEMGQLIAGPFCGQLLADHGATVIKVELPGAGDPMRNWGVLDEAGRSLTWPVIGRNKQSVTLDLRTSAGQEVARRLLADADVLVENFRPGTLERWGLGPDVLHERNPGLIITRITGYGQTGPYKDRASYGSIGEAMGGIRHLTGDPDRPPSRSGVSLGDALAGMSAALGTLTAVQARRRDGRGQVVDASIYEAVLSLMEGSVTEWVAVGHQRQRSGPILPGIAPSNVYPTADGDEVLVAANQDTVFARLADLVDEEWIRDPRWTTHVGRGQGQAELDARLAEWTRTHKAEELLDLLHAGGVPAGRVYRSEHMVDDPQFIARESIVTVSDGGDRQLAMQNVTPKLSGSPGAVRWTGPDLGEHTEQVLVAAGFSAAEIADLRRDGVV